MQVSPSGAVPLRGEHPHNCSTLTPATAQIHQLYGTCWLGWLQVPAVCSVQTSHLPCTLWRMEQIVYFPVRALFWRGPENKGRSLFLQTFYSAACSDNRKLSTNSQLSAQDNVRWLVQHVLAQLQSQDVNQNKDSRNITVEICYRLAFLSCEKACQPSHASET